MSAMILVAMSQESSADARAIGGHKRAVLTADAHRQSGPRDWPAYLYSNQHPSFAAADTGIKVGNVGHLVRKWHFRGDPATQAGQPDPGFLASPTVSAGAIYIGSNTGWFYKLNESTGAVRAKRFLGFQTDPHCSTKGIIATATVATDPNDGQQTVYVAAPGGFLYALSASDLSVKWRSVISTSAGFFDWSSPTVINGRIFVGVSSNCDAPLVPGGLVSFNQVTGPGLRRSTSCRQGLVAAPSGRPRRPVRPGISMSLLATQHRMA